MELIADALLIAGALGAAAYCRTLARRLGALKDLDSGLGAAIAALSRQVDELRASLDAAKNVSGDQTREIAQLTARAEMAAGRLELLLASLHEGERRRPVAAAAQSARGERLRAAARADAEADRGEPSPATPSPAPPRTTAPRSEDDADAALEAVLRALARREGEAPAGRARRAPEPADEEGDEPGADDRDRLPVRLAGERRDRP